MRGESGRVAARVRQLLSQPAEPVGGHSGDEPEHRRAGPDGPAPSWWRRLSARLPVRLDPGRRAALAVGLAVLAAAIVTGLWVLAARPRALAVSAPSSGAIHGSSPVGTGAAAPRLVSPPGLAPPPSTSAVVVVDVAGKVRRPGLYRLPAGARVDDAVRSAGGALAGVDLSSLNLAARVVDGQQIRVGFAPTAGPAAAPSAGPDGSGETAGAARGPVDLNTAGLELLETLPGVGPVLGQHILDWRAAHGRFATVDQLLDVTGIGPAKFATLRGLVSV